MEFIQETLDRVTVLQCLQELYLSHNVAMSMAGSQVQGCVVSPVHDINARSSHDEHVHHVGATLSASPVERAEAMVISTGAEAIQAEHVFLYKNLLSITWGTKHQRFSTQTPLWYKW